MTHPPHKPGQFGFSIDLPVRNDWRNVDIVRSSVQNCFSAVFKELDGCHALSMVTGELLENAIKYGSWGGKEQVFRLSITGHSDLAKVVVRNPAADDSDHVARLQEAIAWIRGFDDPAEAYRARLREIADSGADRARQLGLVRVAYEGNGILSASYEQGIVTVTADMTL